MYRNSPEQEQQEQQQEQNVLNVTPLAGIDPAVFRQAVANNNDILEIVMVNNEPMVVLHDNNRNRPPPSETTQPELLTSVPDELRDRWANLINIDYDHLTEIPPAPEFDTLRFYASDHRRIGYSIREKYYHLYAIFICFHCYRDDDAVYKEHRCLFAFIRSSYMLG